MDVFVELKAVISDFTSKLGIARGEMEKTSKAGGGHMAALGKAGGLALAGVATAAGGIAIASVKMGADFQQNMTKLVTSGGELKNNLGADMKGVLKLMGQTGTSAQQLASGLYVINSAGYHGAAGLQVLKAAAEGAKTENADLSDVTNGLTTLLNDYRLKAGDAALVTSKMVEATSLGKTTFQELAGSLHTVSPIAHAAGLSMNEVLGAMATMTSEGTPAADAATYLRFAIGNLLNPTQKATKEMEALGLSQVDISKNLGERGLTGTFMLLTDAIQNHMGPAGTVLIEKLQKSAHSTSDFQKVLANLPPVQQTYVGALANMVGGTKGMQAALELTGGSAKVFEGNVHKVGAATTEAGGHVAGWKDIQETFNQKISESKMKVEAMGIKLGLVLIPMLEKVVTWTQKVVDWSGHHKRALEALAGVVATVGAVMVGAWVAVTVAAAAAFVAENLATLGIIAALVLLGAAAVVLAKNWGKIWAEIIFITGVAKAAVITSARLLGDAFFSLIEGILKAGSHLPFVGKYFAEANQKVRDAHADFDTTMSKWATDADNSGRKVGQNFSVGVGKSLDTYMGPVLNRVPSTYMGPVLGRATVSGADTGRYFAGGVGQGLDSFMGPVLNRVPGNYMGPVRDRMTRSGAQTGQDLTVGLAQGVAAATNRATAAANLLVSKTIHQMHLSAQTGSPSKLTMTLGEQMALGVMVGIENKQLAAMKKAGEFSNAVAASMAASSIGMGIPGAAPGGWAAVGKAMAAQYGWTGAEWNALNAVAMRESGWNPNAQNPTSSAYGIAQNIGGRAGYPDPSPAGQIAWMLQYIKSRYGDPINAWAHEMSAGWYDRGGLLPPGLSLALNTTGHAEVVRPGPAAPSGPVTIVLQVDGKTLGRVVLSSLLQEQARRPLGIKAS